MWYVDKKINGCKASQWQRIATFEGSLEESPDGIDIAIDKSSIDPFSPFQIHRTSCMLTVGTLKRGDDSHRVRPVQIQVLDV